MRDCQFGASHPRDLCARRRIATTRPHLVLALGGSSVQGFPLGRTVPFPDQLGAMLEEAHPGEFTVRNLGLMCKDSIYVRRCVEHAVAAEPELLIVYAGHNSYANWGFARPGWKIFGAEHAWLFDLERRLLHTRLLSGLARVSGAFATGPVWGEAEPPDEQFARAREVILDHYTSDIVSVLDLAERHHAVVILVTLVSNLLEYPVRKDQWDGPRAPGSKDGTRRERWSAHFWSGVDHFRAQRFDEALADLKHARDELPRGRAPTELNERIRELARGRRHVRLVDFEKELDRLGAAEGIGCNFFGDETYCDQFHPNTRTQRLVAEAVLLEVEQLRRAGALSRLDAPHAGHR